jgi:hypothetical protein
MVTRRLEIPTTGIGAGPHCDGQVLVYNDLLGYGSNLQPRFVKRYADFGTLARNALSTFAAEVRERRFPFGRALLRALGGGAQSARAISLKGSEARGRERHAGTAGSAIASPPGGVSGPADTNQATRLRGATDGHDQHHATDTNNPGVRDPLAQLTNTARHGGRAQSARAIPLTDPAVLARARHSLEFRRGCAGRAPVRLDRPRRARSQLPLRAAGRSPSAC